jgi:hypothetical protein
MTTAHDRSPETPPPPPVDVFAGDLDGALFEDYFADLEELADVLEVRTKSGPEDRSETPHLSLDQARMLLVVGQVRGVQIRYRHGGLEWIDTLVRQPDSVRLIRMEAPAASEASAPEPDRKHRLRVLS